MEQDWSSLLLPRDTQDFYVSSIHGHIYIILKPKIISHSDYNTEMDDAGIFTDYLIRLGLTLVCQRDAVTNGLAETFAQLSVLEDSDIDAFVKTTSDNNRTRTNANQLQAICEHFLRNQDSG